MKHNDSEFTVTEKRLTSGTLKLTEFEQKSKINMINLNFMAKILIYGTLFTKNGR